MNFQRYVIIFFVILLLIIMIFLGVTMSNNKDTNIPWPPIISSCPDYWTDTPDEPPEEFVTTCSETSIYATVDSSGNTTTDPSGNIIQCNTNSDTCKLIGTTEQCTLTPNPDYNSIPIPHVSGSRCIGTIGQNNGSFGFDANNSTFNLSSNEKPTSANCTSCKTATMDFTKPDGDTNYIGANGNCNKQNWAQNHGNISWDGITYGYGENNPCWTP